LFTTREIFWETGQRANKPEWEEFFSEFFVFEFVFFYVISQCDTIGSSLPYSFPSLEMKMKTKTNMG